MTTPAARQMALEYKIWAFASPRGSNVTPGEIAEELGVTKEKVGAVLKRKGWTGRVRRTGPERYGWNSVTRVGQYIADDVAHGRINMSVD